MISANSILRSLPKGLDRKQALFFDGLRHAAEITGFAYSRLQSNCTTIATEKHRQEDRADLYTAIFLDAWAIVDSIDRFRSLWQLLPIPGQQQTSAIGSSFASLTQPIRDLRNVADHLAQRADYVVAKQGTALGVISWVTCPDPIIKKAISCAIVPGTLQSSTIQLPMPSNRTIELPSGFIHLRAGEHNACLSDALPHMRALISSIEYSLDKEFRDQGVGNDSAHTDVLIVGGLTL